MTFRGAAAALFLFTAISNAQVEAVTSDGVRLVTSVRDGHIASFDGTTWRPRFWRGLNAGVTTPGHFPGELSVSQEDWSRWFPLMKRMNAQVLRVYTILPPGFYQALLDFNRTQEEPLWVLHGIWSPEEELIGDDGAGRSAFTPAITSQFTAEIADAVRAVHGDLAREKRPGHAGGVYAADISPYLLGWLVGSEWYQYSVAATNRDAAGRAPYVGRFFRAKPSARPFESWLASMLDRVAEEEMRYRWQHPVGFVNWITTDPLSHPAEPNFAEDLVPVDPNDVEPTAAWVGGYFASYHIYPYYPDVLRWEPAYQEYKDVDGNLDPYAGYLNQLRAYHRGIPLLVTEFGVPSSRGLAHYGPAGRNQGLHTEREQGEIDAGLLKSIYNEGYDGAILFSWQEEWYKFTWNTVDLEFPFDRRPLWQNRLTNERFFGVLAMDPGGAGAPLTLDGRADDWESLPALPGKQTWQYSAMEVSAVHDEAYLHLLLRKRTGEWDFDRDRLYLGMSTLAGGSNTSDQAPGVTFSQPIQFLLRLGSGDSGRWSVLSAYDQHTYRWGVQQPIVPSLPEYADPRLGLFLPWKLLVNRSIELPASQQRIAAEEVEIGMLRRADVADDDLADWQARGSTLEIRIPWMLLGFMDPSSLTVWDWPYRANGLVPVQTDGVRIEPHLITDGAAVTNQGPVATYGWSGWELPAYRERLKPTYSIVAAAMANYSAPRAPRADQSVLTKSPEFRQRRHTPGLELEHTVRSSDWRRAHPK